MKRKRKKIREFPKEARALLARMAQDVVTTLCRGDPDLGNELQQMGLEGATEALLELLDAGLVRLIVDENGNLLGIDLIDPVTNERQEIR